MDFRSLPNMPGCNFEENSDHNQQRRCLHPEAIGKITLGWHLRSSLKRITLKNVSSFPVDYLGLTFGPGSAHRGQHGEVAGAVEEELTHGKRCPAD
jgi:hypothetical protein